MTSRYLQKNLTIESKSKENKAIIHGVKPEKSKCQII